MRTRVSLLPRPRLLSSAISLHETRQQRIRLFLYCRDYYPPAHIVIPHCLVYCNCAPPPGPPLVSSEVRRSVLSERRHDSAILKDQKDKREKNRRETDSELIVRQSGITRAFADFSLSINLYLVPSPPPSHPAEFTIARKFCNPSSKFDNRCFITHNQCRREKVLFLVLKRLIRGRRDRGTGGSR